MTGGAWLLCAALALGQGDDRQLLGEIEAYDTQIATLDVQLATLEGTLAAAEADHAAALAAATEAETHVSLRADSARALVRSLYRLRRFGVLRLLFGAGDPLELRRRAAYLRSALAADELRTTEFATLATTRRDAAAKAEAANAATRQLRDQLVVQRESLDAERTRRRALLRDIRGSQALTARVLTETATARSDFDGSVRAREATMPESAAATANVDFRSLRGRLPRPVSGRLLRGFGGTTDPATGVRVVNNGLDFEAAAGSAFRVVADGTVTRAGYVKGYGQMVMVQHGSYATLYAHANGLKVVVDQAVRVGDVLGTVGTTGLAEDTVPQLHFELRYNGTPQDPTEWLAR